jgi:hypothetical protein
VGDLSDQIHDFNPGIRRSGLFWTVPVPARSIDADLRQQRSRFHLRHRATPDFHDFFNSVSPNAASVPGHITFDAHYTGNGPRQRLRDRDFRFVGRFMPADMRVSFTVSDDNAGVVYHSVLDGQVTVGGVIGHERNGRFFR